MFRGYYFARRVRIYFAQYIWAKLGEAIKMQNLHRLRCGTIAYCISENNVWRLSTSRPRQFAKISDVPTWQTIPKRLCKFIFCVLSPPPTSLFHISSHSINVFQTAISYEDKNHYIKYKSDRCDVYLHCFICIDVYQYFYFASMIMNMCCNDKIWLYTDDWIKYNCISMLLPKINFAINLIIQYPTIYLIIS